MNIESHAHTPVKQPTSQPATPIPAHKLECGRESAIKNKMKKIYIFLNKKQKNKTKIPTKRTQR